MQKVFELQNSNFAGVLVAQLLVKCLLHANTKRSDLIASQIPNLYTENLSIRTKVTNSLWSNLNKPFPVICLSIWIIHKHTSKFFLFYVRKDH